MWWTVIAIAVAGLLFGCDAVTFPSRVIVQGDARVALHSGQPRFKRALSLRDRRYI